MSNGLTKIDLKLAAFKRKYYLNLFVKGGLLTLLFVLLYFIVVTIIEYNLWLDGFTRLIIVILFFGSFIFCVYKFLKAPLLWIFKKKELSGEESAQIIGNHFPEISDRLLNVIQLARSSHRTDLANASIFQKMGVFESIPFETAIDLKSNTKYLKYLSIPLLLILSILLFNRNILTQSTNRIVNFNKEFTPEAPFQFQLVNKNLNAFLNEDYVVKIKVVGTSLPESVYLVTGINQLKLTKDTNGLYSYTFEKVQNDITFNLQAAGFNSPNYTISLLNRPELTALKLNIKFPAYLKQSDSEIVNAGDIEIPEGSNIEWKLSTLYTTKATVSFSLDSSKNLMYSSDNQLFSFKKSVKNSDQYVVDLENEHTRNKEKISHTVTVIKDQSPEINLIIANDTLLFKQIYFTGQLKDDHGLTQLVLHYETHTDKNSGTSKKKSIPINNGLQSSFFYNWQLDSVTLKPGDKLTYFLEVWDNDGVNGRKSTKSETYTFTLPNSIELKNEIIKSQAVAESKINESISKAAELKKSLEETQQKLKGKQTIDWQDKKKVEDIIQQKQELDKAIKELQKQNELLEQKKENFSEENEKIKEKSEQIQKLMDELLDEETKKMFEELQKVVKENTEPSQLQKMLDKINKKEINLEKELERTLELFKELQFDYKVDQAINQLKEEIKQQENIEKETNELTDDKKGNSEKNSTKLDSLAKEQEKLNKDLDNLKKTSEEIEKLSNELEKPVDAPSKEDINQVDQDQKNSKNQLNQKQTKKAAESQKKAIEKMNEMKNSLESSQNSMEMEINLKNLEALRQATHGLIKLSFDQEQIMKDFGSVQQSDPKYLTLSQNQIKIKDDAKVLEDSLQAISKHDPFMGNFVIEEIGSLNDHLDKSTENIKERKKQNASTEMQLSMTSINNLALMLDDHINSMMQMMANAKPGKGKKKDGKEPSLSQLQKQINDKLKEMKKGGKGDRSYSEDFARIAAEQERIRRALQEMENKMKQQGGKMPGGNLSEEMEKTEMDLVNKQITEQTLKRQQEIITRLLETEKSMREQNQDEERKGETAKDYAKDLPPAFEEYIKLKQKEAELLQTVPIKLLPYYKKEANDYFKRVETDKSKNQNKN